MAMKRCPRCHSSMFSDIESMPGSERRIWKCIGCGREILQDEAEQAEDDRMQDEIAKLEKPSSHA
jgi:transposase-like protein